MNEATESDCYQIVKYFDGSSQEALRYTDFLQMIMPCDSQHLRAEVAQRPNFEVPQNEKLGQRVERELACLFEKEIALNRVMEELKQGIQCNKQFHYMKAY